MLTITSAFAQNDCSILDSFKGEFELDAVTAYVTGAGYEEIEGLEHIMNRMNDSLVLLNDSCKLSITEAGTNSNFDFTTIEEHIDQYFNMTVTKKLFSNINSQSDVMQINSEFKEIVEETEIGHIGTHTIAVNNLKSISKKYELFKNGLLINETILRDRNDHILAKITLVYLSK